MIGNVSQSDKKMDMNRVKEHQFNIE